MDSSIFAFGFPVGLGLIALIITAVITRDGMPSIITGLGFTIIGIVIAMMVLVAPTGEKESTETYTLKTVGTGTQIEGRGSFLLGGYIESSPSYQFMMEVPEENGSGVYNEGVEAKITDVKVYEVDGEEPTVTIHTTATTNPFGDELRISKKYEVRVPEGSIVESTDIDFSK